MYLFIRKHVKLNLSYYLFMKDRQIVSSVHLEQRDSSCTIALFPGLSYIPRVQ